MTMGNWVTTPLAHAIGWALFHFIWQGAAIALLLAGVLYLWRPSSARVRYAAACVALFAMPVVFGITLSIYARTAPPLRFPAAELSFSAVSIPGGGEISVPLGQRMQNWLPLFAPLWMAGVLLFYGRALASWVAARRLRATGVCAPPDEWRLFIRRLAERMGIARSVTILESCLTDVPVVLGFFRPVILLPLGMLAGLDADQVECILLHELAHIRRLDYAVNLMQTAVEGLLFYHPAVWWISRVVRSERENCCDDVVVGVTGDARRYAATLATLEQQRRLVWDAALAATGGSLMKRIRRLLDQPEGPRAGAAPAFTAAIILISAAIGLSAWQPKPAPAPQSQTARQTNGGSPGLLFRVTATDAQQSEAAAPQKAQAKSDTWANELETPYRKWINEDVAYIITDAERAAFKRLQTNEEREKFIEQFWVRRDPTPGTPENEFKQEHYRRIGYANEHFGSRIPGWKTDRGRIYITYGPPDEIDDHSSGGTYELPGGPEGGVRGGVQGGVAGGVPGAVSGEVRKIETYPFQQWRYRHIDGIGDNVIVEFVDPTFSGEFRMTTDPNAKNIETAPKMLLEVQGGRARAELTADGKLAVTGVADGNSGAIRIYGQVTTANGNIAASLEDEVGGAPGYSKTISLPAGSYTVKLVLKNLKTGRSSESGLRLLIK